MFNHSRILFIDYLKRVFNLTEIDKMENKCIEEYLHNKLGLCDNDKAYNVAVLTGKINEISDLPLEIKNDLKDESGFFIKDKKSKEWKYDESKYKEKSEEYKNTLKGKIKNTLKGKNIDEVPSFTICLKNGKGTYPLIHYPGPKSKK